MKLKVLLAAMFLATSLAHAVKVDMPGQAEAGSSHVFTGKVTAIYSKTIIADPYTIVASVAQVAIESVQKGEGLTPGATVYVRYESSRNWTRPGTPSPGPGPHTNVPKEGDRRKVCVNRNPDGTLDVYYVSGFQQP